ncbi:putative ribonuclease H-like domain-containing protein [Tanacetum coccineum]
MESDFVFTTAEDIGTANVPVTTAGAEISSTSPEDKTAGISTVDASDDITLAETLMEIRRSATKSQKEIGVAFRNVEETPRLIRSTTTLQPLPTIDPKDKELAQRLHEEELAELERMQRERTAQEEASKAAIDEELDDIQAMIEADEQMVARLQSEEQEKYTIKEKARMLVEMIVERKSYLLHKEQRKSELKGRSYVEIQKLFDKAYKQVSSFVPMDSDDKEKDSEKKAGGSRKKTIARQRTGEKQSEESVKRQKMEDDAERAELKEILEVASDSDKPIDVEFLSTRYPIVDWKTQTRHLGFAQFDNEEIPYGEFDEKADEGFFVGYSINSKTFKIFNTRTRKVEEYLHINFLENKPNVAGSGPDWLFDIDLLTNSMNYEPKEGYANNTNRDSTVSPSVSTVGQNFTNADDLPTDPLIPDLEDIGIFSGAYDDEDVGAEPDLNNLEITMNDRSIQFPGKVYKVEKALYGLHQAPRAWYETLSTYLLENGFRRGTIDKTLFIKKDKGDILLVQVYVDDIIFGSTKNSLCVEFEQMMHKKFQMSSMGELTFFLGLQVMQKDDGIFISQDKYVADILKKFDFVTVKTASTPIETNKALLKDEEAEDVDVHLYRSMIGSLMYLTASRPDIMFVVCACARDSPFDLEAFSDSNYAGASLDRKSTTGGCQFLGKRLISWQCKKQTIVANSTTEAEYVAAANCCGQVLWIQNQMLDYGFNFMNTKIHIDNESTICIVKIPSGFILKPQTH